MNYKIYFQVKGMKEIKATSPQDARAKFLAWAKSITPRTLANYLHLILPGDIPEITRVAERHDCHLCREKRYRNAELVEDQKYYDICWKCWRQIKDIGFAMAGIIGIFNRPRGQCYNCDHWLPRSASLGNCYNSSVLALKYRNQTCEYHSEMTKNAVRKFLVPAGGALEE